MQYIAQKNWKLNWSVETARPKHCSAPTQHHHGWKCAEKCRHLQIPRQLHKLCSQPWWWGSVPHLTSKPGIWAPPHPSMARARHLDQDQAERIYIRAVVLPSLLYGCETWPCYRKHTKKLDQFHLRCLRKVLRVSWKDHVPNQEILHWAELAGIEAMLNQAQFRWSGHVTRMEDSRLPKQLFHAELSTGKQHKGGQRKRYKDVLKSTLKACNIPVDEWQALAQDRPAWRAAIRKGTKHFERSRLQSLDDKRLARKNRVPNPSTAVPCQLCGKICASTFGLQCTNTSTDASSLYSKDYYYIAQKTTIHQVTAMLATSKNVLFPGHNHDCWW